MRCRRASPPPQPAAQRCAPSVRPHAPWPACPTRAWPGGTSRLRGTTRVGPGRPPWPGCGLPRSAAWKHRPPPTARPNPPPPKPTRAQRIRKPKMTPSTPLTPVLSRYWDDPESWSMQTYRRHDGYRALEKALTMDPDDVIAAVKDSGLRGRGGAGFPTGIKWSFIPQGDGKPHYLVVNADESEPGSCKDIPLMLATPHVLSEGASFSPSAIRPSHAFIYVRGEVMPVLRRLPSAVAEAYAAGYLGKDIRGTGFDLELIVHAGAGAYICGEETALLDSLEGRRGQPRLRPPFPAAAGVDG